MKTKLIAVRIPITVLDKLDSVAKREKMNRSELIKSVLINSIGGRYVPEHIEWRRN